VTAHRGSLSAFFATRRRTRLAILLSAPMLWLVVAYLGSLGVMFVSALWSTDSFTGNVVKTINGHNLQDVYTDAVYRRVALRTGGVAVGVTLIDAVIAFPVAFYMSKVAARRTRLFMVVAILTPLWASYLVKAYAWRVLLANGGPIDWVLGGPGRGPGYGLFAVILVLSYLWLPYMILPIYAGLERIPASMIDASGDLGGRPGLTFRRVILPLAMPAVVAGSIFTFALTLGDYITPQLVSSTQFIGNVVYANVGIANNLPLAAAFATVPVVVMIVYLLVARRMGAFEAL
jgi:putative spermidine/putrescine transport system permease protein